MLVAYIDPGFGTLVWQMAVSAFVGLLFYLKKTREMIVASFRRVFQRGQNAENTVAGLSPRKVETKTDAK